MELPSESSGVEQELLAQQANELTAQAQKHSMNGDFEAALALVMRSAVLAEQSGSHFEMFRSANVQGIIYRNLGAYRLALELFHRALSHCKKAADAVNTPTVLSNIGIVHRNLAEYGKSLEYFASALAACELAPNGGIRDSILGNIGVVYNNLDDVPRAIEYFLKALAFAEERGDMLSYARHLGNIGNAHAATKRYNEGLEYLRKALAIYEESGNRHGIMINTGNIGNVLLDTGNYDDALGHLRHALIIARELGDKQGVAIWTACMGKLFASPDFSGFDPELAESHLLEASAIFVAIGDRSGEFKAYRDLAMLYKRQERWREYAERFEQYHEIERQVQGLKAKEQADRFAHEREVAVINRNHEVLAQKNAELEEANRFKSKLLGIAAHDLKNPLGNVLGGANVLLDELHETDPNREWLDIIVESARRMLGLIGDLLESSSAALGAITLNIAPCNVSDIVRSAVETHSPAAARKGQRFRAVVHSDLWISGDAARLYQVVENIVSNAVKYSPRNTEIGVEARLAGVAVRIEVRDSGQGLSAEDMSKLFGQFQRLSAQPTGGESSTGLGLHIAKHIIELHGGKIWAESKGKGHGAAFIAELPAQL